MFEKYTESARKAVFVAKYEASQLGSEYIETEHLLLSILRTDGLLALRLLKAPEKVESIRHLIEKQYSHDGKLSKYVDLPLSRECKRVLAYGAEDSAGPTITRLRFFTRYRCSARSVPPTKDSGGRH